MISRDDIQKLATLAHFAVSEEELRTFASEMDAILGYVSDIDTLANQEENTTEKPLLYNVMREDTITNEPGSYTDDILTNAPETKDGFIRVKKIL